MVSYDRERVRQFALFEHMDASTFDDLVGHAAYRRFQTGDTVFEQGGNAVEFFVLVQGKLKVTQVTEDGQQVIIRMVVPGDLFGIAQALKREDYPGTASAVLPSSALCWPMNYWSSFVKKDASLAVGAMQTVGERLQESHTRLREMATEEVERRVAHTILRLIQQSGTKEADGIRIDFPISKQDIAEMTGTTLHTVSRILTSWQDKGLVKTGRQKLLVCEPHKLVLIADNFERTR